MTMAALMHELVNWSSASDQCDVLKFVEKYGRYVPLLVRIADGYAGRDESMHLLAQNEVSIVIEFCTVIFLFSYSIYTLFMSFKVRSYNLV